MFDAVHKQRQKLIAQSYSDIESLQFADLIRDYFHRRKLHKYRFQEEVLRDLREERQIKSFSRISIW